MEPIQWGNVFVGVLWLIGGFVYWRSHLKLAAIAFWIVSFALLSQLIAVAGLYTLAWVFT
jgi:hypothetical protein